MVAPVITADPSSRPDQGKVAVANTAGFDAITHPRSNIMELNDRLGGFRPYRGPLSNDDRPQ